MTRGTRRYGLYDVVFATNPWNVMRGSVNSGLSTQAQPEALAFLEQAEDFFRGATVGTSANPLLLYYAFLNLGKALIRVRGQAASMDQAMHGLKEETTPGGTELKNSRVIAKDGGSSVNVYPELVERLGFVRPANNDAYPVLELLPQIVVGHRIWREAGSGHRERFVDLKDIEFIDDRAAKELWLRFYVGRGDLSRYGITRDRLLREGGLSGLFREVDIAGTQRSADWVCLEQQTALRYTGRPTDVVADVVALVRPHLWRIVSAIPGSGYRRYYLHLTSAQEVRLPQLASLWALFFYFGSVVRYRPHLFDELLGGVYGAFIEEFVHAQPEQMLYMLASELCQREIARPAIV